MHTNIRWGVIKSLGWSSAAAAIALVSYIMTDGESFERSDVTLTGILLTYLLAATVGGVLLGVLRPLTKHWVGATFVGVIVAWPISFGLFLVTGSSVHDLASDWTWITGLAVAYGVVGTFVLRRIAAVSNRLD